MPAFAYVGDHEETELFGLLFPRGVPVEVTGEHAVFKLSNNSHFVQEVDGVQVVAEDKPRRGRPPKAK